MTDGSDQSSTGSTPPPLPRRRDRGFALFWWSAMAWGFLAVVVVAVQGKQHGWAGMGDPERIGFLTGAAAGFPLIVLLIAWFVYRGSRSNLAANVTFTALVMLGAMGHMSPRIDRREQDAAFEQMKQDIEGIRADALSRLEAEDLPETAGTLKRAADAMRKAASRLTGIDQKVGIATADVIEELVDGAKAYDATWASFTSAGGIDASTLDSLPAVRERLRMLRGALATTEAMVAAYDAMPDKLIERVRLAGASASQMRRFESGMNESMADYRNNSRALRYDIEIGRTMEDILSLLGARFGSWRYVESEQLIEFDSDDDADAYNKLLLSMNEAVEQQAELMRQTLARPLNP